MSLKSWSARIVWGIVVLLLLCLGIAWVWMRRERADIAGTPPAISMTITSTSFIQGGAIPPRFTCAGANVSPELQWSTPPAGTQSFVIVMDDPDAPLPFTHWLAYGIPADTRNIPESASTPAARLAGAKEGSNSFDTIGYGGPCPPNGTHHYNFRVYALDTRLALPAGQSKQQLAEAVKGHVLAEGLLTGTFSQ